MNVRGSIWGKKVWKVGPLLYDGTMILGTLTHSSSHVAFRIWCMERENELTNLKELLQTVTNRDNEQWKFWITVKELDHDENDYSTWKWNIIFFYCVSIIFQLIYSCWINFSCRWSSFMRVSDNSVFPAVQCRNRKQFHMFIVFSQLDFLRFRIDSEFYCESNYEMSIECHDQNSDHCKNHKGNFTFQCWNIMRHRSGYLTVFALKILRREMLW